MATAEDYCGIWKLRIREGSEKIDRAYPLDNLVTIGVDDRGEHILAWADVDGMIHVLAGLVPDQGELIKKGGQDLATGQLWDITIRHSSTSKISLIQAEVLAHPVQPVKSRSPLGEDNLSGNWGAEAHTPPPVPPATFAAP
jgi:hypothetical protein